jgi:hypothetical protein
LSLCRALDVETAEIDLATGRAAGPAGAGGQLGDDRRTGVLSATREVDVKASAHANAELRAERPVGLVKRLVAADLDAAADPSYALKPTQTRPVGSMKVVGFEPT